MIKNTLYLTVIVSLSGNYLYGMQQNQSWWNKLTTWWSKSRIDYVERNLPQVPPHPRYPMEQEQKELEMAAYIGTGLGHKHGSKPDIAQPEVAPEWVNLRGKRMGFWGRSGYYPYKKGQSTHPVYVYGAGKEAYSTDVPSKKELEELRANIRSAETGGERELFEAKSALHKAKIGEEGYGAISEARKERYRAEVQRAMFKPQKRAMKQHEKELSKWLTAKEKIELQQQQIRGFALQREKSFAAIPMNPYGE